MEVFSMVLSLLAYFFSMITAFTVLATVWIGLIGASPFQTVHLQPYLQPAIADVAAAPIDPKDKYAYSNRFSSNNELGAPTR
jgi:hypothetical protein